MKIAIVPGWFITQYSQAMRHVIFLTVSLLFFYLKFAHSVFKTLAKKKSINGHCVSLLLPYEEGTQRSQPSPSIQRQLRKPPCRLSSIPSRIDEPLSTRV